MASFDQPHVFVVFCSAKGWDQRMLTLRQFSVARPHLERSDFVFFTLVGSLA